MAQSVERVSHNHEVVSSILTTPIFLPNRKQNDRGENEIIFLYVREGDIQQKRGNDNNNNNKTKSRRKKNIRETKQKRK